jgi:hypothetical protein
METATVLRHESARIDDLPQLWDGLAKLVREGLGITGFGVQIMDLPPNYTTATHDETDSGQQELYVALNGHGAVVVHGEHDEALLLDPERIVAIGPETERTLTSGPAGLRVLCIGGTPGQGYEPPDWTTDQA